jgi:hypothetical protein
MRGSHTRTIFTFSRTIRLFDHPGDFLGSGGGLMDKRFCKRRLSSYLIEEMNQSILFEDIFEIKALNENGKKFERGEIDNAKAAPGAITHCGLMLYVVAIVFTVNRLHCKGTTFDVDFVVGKFFSWLCFHILPGTHYCFWARACTDVNSELFDVKAGDRIAVVLARYVVSVPLLPKHVCLNRPSFPV